jgi:hypothetical protein
VKVSVAYAVCWGALLPATMATAQTPVAEDAFLPRTQQPSLDTAEQMLTESVVSIDWDEKPLEEVLVWLDDQGAGEVNIVPRWRYLSSVGIGPDTPVTLRFRNTTVGVIMNEALVQLADQGTLRLHGTRNRLILSTAANLDSQLHTRVYEMTDLALQVPNFGDTAPTIELTGSATGTSVFTSRGSSASSGGEQAERKIKERLEEFRAVIEQTIDPDSWDDNLQAPHSTDESRARGRIRVLGQSLIITNTIEVHEKIAGRFSFKRSG